MEQITLEQVNNNVLVLKREIEDIKDILEEDDLELKDEVKTQIEESRRRNSSEFKSQKEIEKKFL